MLWNRGRFDEFQRQADSATAVRDDVTPSQAIHLRGLAALLHGQLRKSHESLSRGRQRRLGDRPACFAASCRGRNNLFAAEFVGAAAKCELAALEAALAATDLRSIPMLTDPTLVLRRRSRSPDARIAPMPSSTHIERASVTPRSGATWSQTFRPRSGLSRCPNGSRLRPSARFVEATWHPTVRLASARLCLPDNLARGVRCGQRA